MRWFFSLASKRREDEHSARACPQTNIATWLRGQPRPRPWRWRIGAPLAPLVIVGVATALSLVALARADQSDGRLDQLFEILVSTANPAQAGEAESHIWQIWIDSGKARIDGMMASGIESMGAGNFQDSIETFGRIVEQAPKFAEGWNKRATAYYLDGQLDASVRDIQRTLALEPRHFGAISGMGLIFLRKGDDHGALEAFEEVLRIHPHAQGARLRVEQLRQKLGRQGA